MTTQFTNHWFMDNQASWQLLLDQFTPSKVLEIGAYEGQGSCFFIDRIASLRPLSLHCVDTWQGGVEHQAGERDPADMPLVQQRFQANVNLACSGAMHAVNVQTYQTTSDTALHHLNVQPEHVGSFDLIYVDGSHQAADVLSDAVLAFRLLKLGGVMVLDDYLWLQEVNGQPDVLNAPKIAIDAFTTIYQRKLRQLFGKPNNQVYVQKIAH
jgi:cephalosporin hydroxylase